MVTDNVYSFIGLAMKAGKVVSGEQSCEKIIKCHKAFLVIVSEDASFNTVKKFTDDCSYNGVPFLQFGEKERLGKSIGKDLRSVIAITDEGFSKRLTELITENKQKNTGVG
ncbi:MAG: 50S ribosomal protein L7ae [Clostridiaceae bacterium]|nr:50S ribosomal protein L7ae [Clostridiaceae bacterium]